ncbi:Ca2+-binding RTX toxin-like protein [Rhodobacter aestuarii]|uniref:Ca2+-binding protein, RTX toxin-related n=1 Tax=Rhodobacter aestuarii TaxID=453582 RepID=A0A1N7MAT9_9RHOB|nr:Hint domain-containing protein [Rhodobacter aestuarii]PTV94963.1 Ca2+-binding RTX toxin-like protein [Rhodobacter aestuarii]SIS83226.1 Ca2+-binding protein, RTX toxin-related [Rhodobacter aestuarii]
MATYNGSSRNNSYTGTAGSDQIYGNDGNDTLNGAGGDDLIDGGTGNDLIYGGDGADTLSGGSGYNTIYGGAGNDVWLGGTNEAQSAGTDAVYLEDGDDFATLGWFYTGNADTLDGGSGNDTLSMENFPDTLNSGITLNDDGSSTTIAFGTVVRNFENVIGNGGNNALTGNSSANMLDGGAGNDTLYGGAGDDTLNGGAGADQLDGGTGMDYVDYTDSDAGVNVNLASGSGTGGDAQGDTLGGIDGIYGSDYDDTLIGFDLADYSDSEYAFTNVFYGNGGNDYIDGAGADDSLYGGTGNDTVLGGWGNDLVDGGEGDDSLDGGDGNDTVLGGAGDDTLNGGAGDDYLDAGTGSATINGGAGSDTIYVHANENTTVIGSEDAGDTDTDVLILERDTGATIVYNENDPESGTILWANGTTTTFENIENIQYVPCFTPGTRIETKRGLVPVERLNLGDRVLTRDNGYQPIRWIGRRALGAHALAARPQLQPVQIAQGALGEGLPEADMLVSPQHRMLISGTRAELLFGEGEVLAAALHMVGLPGITRATRSAITYLHLMFDAHEIIRADGAWTESFQPGDHTLAGLETPQRDELFELFPQLRQAHRRGQWAAARLSLKPHEVRVLLAA